MAKRSLKDRILSFLRIRKSRRGVVPALVLSTGAQIRKPRYDFVSLWENWKHSWILEAIDRALTQEIMKGGWQNVPKFKVKCEVCGREYQETVEQCTCGSRRLRKPDEKQLQVANRLITKPNSQTTFREFLRSLIDYELALGNEFISIGTRSLILNGKKQRTEIKENAELYVEDARFIHPVADVYGRLGDPRKYFCPRCWDENVERLARQYDADSFPYDQLDQAIDIMTLPEEQRKDPRCPKCGGKLVQTAYVMEVNGKVHARWGKDEMIHASLDRVLPELYGTSKLVVLWKVIETIKNMDDYNWEVYGQGHVGKIIQLPGYDELEIAEIIKRIEQELQGLGKRDVQTGKARLEKKIRVVLLGGKRGAEPAREIPFMPDLEAMQSKEFYSLYLSAACMVYGVQPIFAGTIEKGKTGTTPILQIRVQDRTTKMYQQHWEDLFNYKIYPKFGITDWVFKFGKIEERDELREAQVMHTKAATALTLARAGFTVRFDENGELEVSGEAKIPEGTRVRVQEPRREEEGAPTGVASVRPEAETRESERTGELVMRSERSEDIDLS